MRGLDSSRLLSFLLLMGFGLTLMGQTSKETLEKRKTQLQAEIEVANGILRRTQQDRELTLNQVQALEQKIRAREALIATVRDQIGESEREIERQNAQIDSLDQSINTLKDKYAGMIRAAQRRGSNNSALAFVFASEDLQQALKRLYYLRQYSEFRLTQVDEIKALQTKKERVVNALEAEQGIKRQLLGQEVSQREELVNEKAQQETAVANLSRKESQITTEIRQKRSELEKLKQQIERIIQEELRRQQEAARKKAEEANANNGTNTPPSSSNAFALTPEGEALAKDFATNKGKLPWPVERGIITQNFGINAVPGTSGVTINNPGVDIGTPTESKVRAVFQGEVSTVVRIPGANRVVLVRHGNYFTVYSNLEDVYVQAGDQVATKQEIGRVAADPETGESTLHFELWMNTNNQDPKPWLGR